MKTTYLLYSFNRVISYLIPVKSRMVPALPRYDHGKRLNILDAQLDYQRLFAELLGIQLDQYLTPKFLGMLAL